MKLPVECPCCGAYSMTQDSQTSALLAVCDVLVIKALEGVGKWIVRADRSRFKVMDGQPLHTAHTIWVADEAMIAKAIRGAWDVVPPLLASHGTDGVTTEAVSSMLDSYVRDLGITGTPHCMDQLVYRFETRLRIPVWHHYEEDHDEVEA